MAAAYPIFLDISDRLVVIVGGGAVAARKARALIECGATRVRVVAPVIAPGQFPPQVETKAEPYRSEHLDGASLVFAATDSAVVNDAVVGDARVRGALVNRADSDDAHPGDFSVPARLRRGAIAIGVSTGGSPALAAFVRDRLAERWDDGWSRLADALTTLRPQILADARLTPAERTSTLRRLASAEAIDVLGREGVAGLASWLEAERAG